MDEYLKNVDLSALTSLKDLEDALRKRGGTWSQRDSTYGLEIAKLCGLAGEVGEKNSGGVTSGIANSGRWRGG